MCCREFPSGTATKSTANLKYSSTTGQEEGTKHILSIDLCFFACSLCFAAYPRDCHLPRFIIFYLYYNTVQHLFRSYAHWKFLKTYHFFYSVFFCLLSSVPFRIYRKYWPFFERRLFARLASL